MESVMPARIIMNITRFPSIELTSEVSISFDELLIVPRSGIPCSRL